MKKRAIIFPLLSIVCLQNAGSQDLNPRVTVTADYIANMADVRKESLPMAVPDSLSAFDLHFDYSVFDTPYRGSYEFQPYSVDLYPGREKTKSGLFYLNAGAGYNFYPELTAVFTPVSEEKMALSLFQDFHGYAGKFSSFSGGKGLRGCVFDESIGAEGRLKTSRYNASAKLEYRSLFNECSGMATDYEAVSLKAALSTAEKTPSKLSYDAELDLKHAQDIEVNQMSVVLAAAIFPTWKIKGRYSTGVDVRLQGDFYGGANTFSSGFLTKVSPFIRFSFGPIRFRAGGMLGIGEALHVRPDIRFDAKLWRDAIGIYGSITGDQFMHDYSWYKERNSWFNALYTNALMTSMEHINFKAGIRGSAWGKLQYDFYGGWKVIGGEAFLSSVREDFGTKIRYADYNAAYACLLTRWKTDALEADAALSYTGVTWMSTSKIIGPPAFSARLRAEYNWQHRIFAGVSLNAESARPSSSYDVPWFADLALFGQYRINRTLAAWARLGNILDMKTSYNPAYIPAGFNATIGIKVNFM